MPRSQKPESTAPMLMTRTSKPPVVWWHPMSCICNWCFERDLMAGLGVSVGPLAVGCGRLRGVWLGRERAGELAARADAQLGEHLAEVVGDGGRAEEQLAGDLRVRGTAAG